MIGKIERRWLRLSLGAKARGKIYAKLIRFLSSDVPIAQALDIIWRHESLDGRKPNAPRARIIDQWRKSVRGGQSFGRAIAGWVPDSDRIVIEGGGEAGKLVLALEKAGTISAASRKIFSTIVGGLAYPTILLAIVVVFLAGFGMFLVPQFDSVAPKETWTGAGAQMAVMSDLVNMLLIPSLVALAALVAGVMWMMPRYTGRFRVQLDKIPPWSLYRLIVGSGFLLTISSMVSSGSPIPDILRTLRRDASPYYRQRIDATLHHVLNGKNLGDALYLTKFEFPDREAVIDLRAYASMNRFDETLETMGDEWLEDSVSKVQAQTAVAKTAGIILVAVTIGWLASGLASISNQISTMAG